MMRSRSSNALLPITTSSSFGRERSNLGLLPARRRAPSNGGVLHRLLTYATLALLLGGSIYGVARLGRGALKAAAGLDDLAVGDGLLEEAGSLGAAGAAHMQRQMEGHLEHGHLHDDVHDRRAALEQQQQHLHGGEGHLVDHLAGQHQHEEQHLHGGEGQRLEQHLDQEDLEQAHLQELQAMERQHGIAQAHALDQQQQQQEEGGGQQGGHAGGGAVGADLTAADITDPALAAHVAAHIAAQQALPQREGPSLYVANLSAVDMHQHILHTADLVGKVTLVVNVASNCGFTEANYAGLTRLYERYQQYGLEIWAVPCNQFAQQEPGSNAEIEHFVRSRYGAKFPLLTKAEVNGPAAHPLFAWLRANAPAKPGHQAGEELAWNWEKFLVDKSGHPVKWYDSEMNYHDLEMDVYNELIRS